MVHGQEPPDRSTARTCEVRASNTMSDLFIYGLCAHLFADWFLQNEWQAEYKSSLKHPAAWVHSGIHLVSLLLVFPWWIAGIVAITHLLIDTRVPLVWWRRMMRQTVYIRVSEKHGEYLVDEDEFCHNSAAFAVGFWQDQVAHILIIAAAAYATVHL